MDTVRYWLAVLAIVTMPPAVLYWFIVHPFIGFWRRVGKLGTFAFLAIFYVALAYWVFTKRDALLGTDFGTHAPLWIPGAVCYGLAVWLSLKVRKHLSWTILTGTPELDADGKGGRLLDQGVYARVRHPRYVAIILGVIAWALFTNFLGSYLLIAFTTLGLAGIVWFEERELVKRFGPEYEEYRRRVPMFIPRFGSTAES